MNLPVNYWPRWAKDKEIMNGTRLSRTPILSHNSRISLLPSFDILNPLHQQATEVLVAAHPADCQPPHTLGPPASPCESDHRSSTSSRRMDAPSGSFLSMGTMDVGYVWKNAWWLNCQHLAFKIMLYKYMYQFSCTCQHTLYICQVISWTEPARQITKYLPNTPRQAPSNLPLTSARLADKDLTRCLDPVRQHGIRPAYKHRLRPNHVKAV